MQVKLILGQLVSRPRKEIEFLCDRISQNELAKKHGFVSTAIVLKPLSWAISIEINVFDEDLMECLLSDIEIINFLKDVLVPTGDGTYFFRISETELDSFDDNKLCSVFSSIRFFSGVPLRMTINSSQVLIDIDLEWIGKFLKKHFSGPFLYGPECENPCRKATNIMDTIRIVLGFNGDWHFRLIEKKISYSTESNLH